MPDTQLQKGALAMSPDKFQALGLQLLQYCTDYLANLNHTSVAPQLTEDHPNHIDFSIEDLPERGIGDAAMDDLHNLIHQSANINGRFMALVLGTALPLGALADFAASVINQISTGFSLTSPHVAAIERNIIRWLAEAIGCSGYTGLLTSGGSMSNLMALTIARENRCPVNDEGLNRNDLIVYASKEIHMSIPKSMAILGLGRKNLRLLDVDANFRLTAPTVAKAIAEDRKKGLFPIALVASSGTLKTGSIDDLKALGDLASQEGLWFHVDGAFGGVAAMALPELFHGLDRADSITLDPHKWLHMPLDCGCLLVRRRAHAHAAFANRDYYVGPMRFNNRLLNRASQEQQLITEETIELSRRFRALKLWLTFRYFGIQAFRQSIKENIEQAHLLGTILENHPDFQLLAPVVLSAVCFRMVKIQGRKIPDDEVDDFNRSLMERIHYRGQLYVNLTMIDGRPCLRACIVNHLTTESDVHKVISEATAAALETEYAKNSIFYHKDMS